MPSWCNLGFPLSGQYVWSHVWLKKCREALSGLPWRYFSHNRELQPYQEQSPMGPVFRKGFYGVLWASRDFLFWSLLVCIQESDMGPGSWPFLTCSRTALETPAVWSSFNKRPQTGWLKNRERFVSYSLGGWESKVKGLHLVRTPFLHHLMLEGRWAKDHKTQRSTHFHGKSVSRIWAYLRMTDASWPSHLRKVLHLNTEVRIWLLTLLGDILNHWIPENWANWELILIRFPGI